MAGRAWQIVYLAMVLVVTACGSDGDNGGGGPGNSLEALPTNQDIGDCGTGQVVATLYDGDGDPIPGTTFSYATTDPSVATVAGGVVTGVSVGTASIIVTAAGLADTVTVTISPQPLTLTVSSDTATLYEGKIRTLATTYRDCHGNTPPGLLTYSSANGAVATFNAGTISGISPGNTIVLVTDGTLSAFVEVSVKYLPGVTDTLTVTGNPFGLAASATQILVTRLNAGAVADAGIPPTSFNETGFATGSFPTDVAFVGAGTKAYVTNQGSQNIGVLDLSTRTQVGSIPVGGDPYRVIVNAAGTLAYATISSNKVYLIDVSTDAIIDSATVGSTPNGLALNPSGLALFVSHVTGSVHVLDALTLAPLDTLPISGTLQDIVVSPDGTTLYVAAENTGLRVWNLSTQLLLTTVPISGAFGARLHTNGDLIIVVGGGNVTMVEVSSLRVVHTEPSGGILRRIAFPPTGLMWFVSNEGGSVLVFE